MICRIHYCLEAITTDANSTITVEDVLLFATRTDDILITKKYIELFRTSFAFYVTTGTDFVNNYMAILELRLDIKETCSKLR